MPQSLLSVLDKIATTLERIEQKFHEKSSLQGDRECLLARAIAIALSTGITNKAEIARRLGVHRSNLTRMRKLNAVLDNIRRHHVLD